MEELADVEVAGRRTLTKLWPNAEWEFTKKVGKAIFTQIPAAIEAKRKQTEKEVRLFTDVKMEAMGDMIYTTEVQKLKQELAEKTALIERLFRRLDSRDSNA